MEKILLIYNPNSGKKNIASHLDKIVDIFESAGKLITLYRIDEKTACQWKKLYKTEVLTELSSAAETEV